MKKIGFKLLIIILSISLGGLVLASIFINKSIDYNFQKYLKERWEEEDQQIISVLETIYINNGSWNNTFPQINNISRVTNAILRIENIKGDLVFDSLDNLQKGRGRQVRKDLPEIDNWDKNQFVRDYKIKVNDVRVGTAYIIKPGQFGIYINSELFFRNKVKRAIFLSAIIIAVITIIISFYFSQRITSPLVKLSLATEKIAAGKYDYRVKLKRRDELAKLGNAFNEMASKLAKLEKIRKESAINLSHELRTPLSIMQNYIEAMEDGIIASDRKNLEDLHSELMRMIKLVDKLGEFTDVQKRIINLSREKINIKNLLKKIIDLYRPMLEKEARKLYFNQDFSELYVKGDRLSLEQLFHNIISNAIKYSDRGDEIFIKSNIKEDRIFISIKDTGKGIKEEDLPYIFERFYRADKSRSTEGAGIGLALSKEIVEGHDGEISVESVSGKGTEFIISLPICT